MANPAGVFHYRLFPQATGKFDITQVPKNWAVPQGWVDPNPVKPGFYVFDCVSVDPATKQPYWDAFMISIAVAQASNPDAGVLFTGGQKALPEGPIPINKAAIPTGWTLGLDILGGVCLLPPPDAVTPTTEVPLTQGLVDRLSALCTKFGV
jgi:hypothetical protein